ncbi:MFS transporter [SAR202 cluster bacterium AD-802-E10_MRT_200m]|nr:MFS transporter [SAR202 cluster bacterium AD-802-E10_MRT_200m]
MVESPQLTHKLKALTMSKHSPIFYGWVIVGIVFLAEFISGGMGGLTIGLFFTPMKEDLGWSLTQLTGAITAQAIAGIAVAPIVGPAIDRFGARPVMLVGALGAGIGLILLMSIESVWHFWLLYALVGALGLHELGQLTAPVVVSKWFVRLRGRATAIATLGTIVGGMIMAPTISVLIPSFGWRSTFGILGGLVLLIMIPPIIFFMKSNPDDLDLLPDGDTLATDTHELNKQPESHIFVDEVTWTLKEALRTKTLWLIIIATNLGSFSASVQSIHVAPFLTEQQGISIGAASLVITSRLIVAALLRLPWGFIVERVPARICLAFAFAGRCFGLIALVVLPYPINIAPFVILSGFGGALGLLQPIIFANYFGRSFQGAIQGVMRPFLVVPQLILPLVVALLYDITGTFNLAFFISAIPGLFGVPLILLAKPPSGITQVSTSSNSQKSEFT